MWSVERSSCTVFALGRFLNLRSSRNIYKHYLQELIVHYNCSLDVSLRNNYSVSSFTSSKVDFLCSLLSSLGVGSF